MNRNAVIDSRTPGHYYDKPTKVESKSTVRSFNSPSVSAIPQPQMQGKIRGHDELSIKHKPTPNPLQIQHRQRDNHVDDALKTNPPGNEPSSSSQFPVHSRPTYWHSTTPRPSAPGQNYTPAISTDIARLIQPYPPSKHKKDPRHIKRPFILRVNNQNRGLFLLYLTRLRSRFLHQGIHR